MFRHCATSRKVAGPIPDGVTGILQLFNSSGRSFVVVDSASNRNEYLTCLGGGVKVAGCLELWEPQALTTLRAWTGPIGIACLKDGVAGLSHGRTISCV